MPRRASAPVHPRLRDPQTAQLFRAILTLKTVEECYRFFEDLLTIGEMRALAARFEVARLLAAGRTYDDIARRTGASSATISRVRRFLEYGADGYRMVLLRLGRPHA
jgi:TrpR-related protein YerC/YecD